MSAGTAHVIRADGITDTHRVTDTDSVIVHADTAALIVPAKNGSGTIYAPGQWQRVILIANA